MTGDALRSQDYINTMTTTKDNVNEAADSVTKQLHFRIAA